MRISDEYLHAKAEAALSGYFRYLAPALKIAGSGALHIASTAEKKLVSRYSHSQPQFQARTSTLVLEAFHTVELVLKAILIEHGEHLLFESLDDYLERRAAAPKVARRRQSESAGFQKILAGSLRAKKEPPAKALKDYVKRVMREPADNFGKSVSPQVAYKRLCHFEPELDVKLSADVLARLTALRNQIIHFGDMSNLLQGASDALHCLFVVCRLRPQKYPLLAQVPGKYSSKLDSYAEMMTHLVLHEIMPRIIIDLDGVVEQLAAPAKEKPSRTPRKKAG